MSKLKKYVLADIPEMSPSQAKAVLAVLDAIIESIWTHHGEHIIAAMPPIKPEPRSTPDIDSDLDLIF